ncbi:MAG: hypothetical protein JOY66_15630 [Acetobacteraceae bacterium]|nr:hypothetical protein [Acetobacteraceae bacterium]
MKTLIIALALLLGVAGGALVPSGPAHAQGWNNTNGGGVQGGGGAG